MAGPLQFACALGGDQNAADFVGHFLAPLHSGPFAVDSRLVDGVWVHLIHEDEPDRQAMRARLAVAWLRRREAELARTWGDAS